MPERNLNRCILAITISFAVLAVLYPSEVDAHHISTKPKFISRATGSSKKSILAKATYYSARFNGRKTATGGRFQQGDKTAATNILPLGSEARVTNLRNGKNTEVKVTDRPRRKRRARATIDLSKTAAEQVGITREEGTAPVRIDQLDHPRSR